jgi:hypothetical protein
MRRLRRLSSVVGMAPLATLLLAPAARAQATVFRFEFQLTGLDAPTGVRGEG